MDKMMLRHLGRKY